jgi:hypothetical protein
MVTLSKFGCSAVALILTVSAVLAAQTRNAPSSQVPSPTLTALTKLQADFLQRVKTTGFTCPFAVPPILIEDVPSFGQYNEQTNTLRTSDWALLQPQEKALFVQLSGPGATAIQVRQLFEVAAHRWIFIHEMGHWVQECLGAGSKRPPYHTEFDANRIALAYWREVDPAVVQTMIPVFQGVVDHMPSPVPAGQSVETYFNTNYQTLGPSPAYPWFMSRMNVAAAEQSPAPSFAKVIGEAGK